MKLISSGMNSCSDIIGCLQSVRFLPVFWNLDLQSLFPCNVFVYYFFSLSPLCSPRGASLRSPESRTRSNGSSGFCPRVAWRHSRLSHRPLDTFVVYLVMKLCLPSITFLGLGPVRWSPRVIGSKRFYLVKGWCGILSQPVSSRDIASHSHPDASICFHKPVDLPACY